MKEHFFEERGLYYRTNTLQKDRETLVFVHGLVGSSSAWRAYEAHFKNSVNVVTFDLRGHGYSKKWPHASDYTLEYFAEDLFLLLKFLQLEKIILVSHSFATLVAFEFLSAHQNMVSRAVFLSPSFSLSKYGKTKGMSWLPRLGSALFALLPSSLAVRGQTDYTKYRNSRDWDVGRTIADTRNTTVRVWLYVMKNSYNADFEHLLPHITIPTLIIHGKDDSMFPINNSFEMERKIKGAKLIILKHTDHIIVLNNTSEIISALEDFLS